MTLAEYPDRFDGTDKKELVRLMIERPKWRHHHHVPALQNLAMSAYVKRVQTLFHMVDAALGAAGYLHRLHRISLADLACSEGFVTLRYQGHGLRFADCFDLSIDQIERFQMVRAYHRKRGSRIYRLDLDRPAWHADIGHVYDVVLCLGILYHVENPILFLRSVLECVVPGGACVIESDTPLDLGDAPAFSMRPSTVAVSPGEMRQLWELRPNRAAVVQMLRHVGFEGVTVMPPPHDAACKYLASGAKSVFLARRPPGKERQPESGYERHIRRLMNDLKDMDEQLHAQQQRIRELEAKP